MKGKRDTGLASAADCGPLYDLIKEIRDLTQWNWMEEQEIFGVQDPTTGEKGMVTRLGPSRRFAALFTGSYNPCGLIRSIRLTP